MIVSSMLTPNCLFFIYTKLMELMLVAMEDCRLIADHNRFRAELWSVIHDYVNIVSAKTDCSCGRGSESVCQKAQRFWINLRYWVSLFPTTKLYAMAMACRNPAETYRKISYASICEDVDWIHSMGTWVPGLSIGHLDYGYNLHHPLHHPHNLDSVKNYIRDNMEQTVTFSIGSSE